MVDEGSKRNGCDDVVMGSKSETRNGFVPGLDNGGSCSLQTYKRRRYSKSSYTSSSETKCLDRKTSVNSVNPLSDKTTKEPFDLGFNNSSCNQDDCIARTDSHDFVHCSGESSLKHWRKVVLQQMYQSLPGSEGGLKECIRDALEFHPQSRCTTSVRESVLFGKGLHKCASNGAQNIAKGHERVMSNGSANESNEQTNTELCKRAFFDILTSENFRELCNLLFENFSGMRVDRVFDFSSVNARMKEGAYEISPVNFHSDIQQVFIKLEKIGTEMVTLAKNLSGQSRPSCCEQVGGSIPRISKDGKNELITQEPDEDRKPEQTEAYTVYRVCTCRHCGEKAEWRNCLVCDSCEEMYHISCTKFPLNQIPPATWYCTSCIDNGALSLHNNCTLCDKLHSPGTKTLTEKPDPLQNPKEDVQVYSATATRCYICRTNVKDSEDFRICTHWNCPHSRYHIRCLSSKQLNSYGPRWYCPSCLCRACLIDRDDDDIILCDACDDAYHIDCLDPPQYEIPKGQWFCRKCDARVKRIREVREAFVEKAKKERERVPVKEVVKAKRVKPFRRKFSAVFEMPWPLEPEIITKPYKGFGKKGGVERVEKKKGEVKKRVPYKPKKESFKPVEEPREEDGLDKSVGVDMLLTAAKTLEECVGVETEKS